MLKSVSTISGFIDPTFSGDVTLSNGNLVIGTAGKGIDFSADGQAAGMTSELLDDYEEGTWTPIKRGITTAGTFTADEGNAGFYVKIGRCVYLYAVVKGTLAGAAGARTVENLPFLQTNIVTAYAGFNLTQNNAAGFRSRAITGNDANRIQPAPAVATFDGDEFIITGSYIV